MVADKKPAPAKVATKAAPAKVATKAAPAKVATKAAPAKVATKAAPAAAKEGDAAKKSKIPKGRVTNALRRKNMMMPTKDAKALVKPNSVRMAKKVKKSPPPAKKAKKPKTPKECTPEIAAKIAAYATKRAELKKKWAAMPPREIKQQPKKVVPGYKKDIKKRADLYNKNKKNYNMTRRAIAKKTVNGSGGKIVYIKKVSKQTARSMSNPKALLKKKVSQSVGKSARKSVISLARAERISHANRQAIFALKDPKNDTITKISKRSLPQTFLGKYAPKPAAFRTISMRKLPEGTTQKDIMKALQPFGRELRRITIITNKKSGKKATKDASGKAVVVSTGKALVRVKSAGALTMIFNNTRKRIKIGGKDIVLTEAKLLSNKFDTKAADVASKKTFQAHQKKVAARKIAKVTMNENLVKNKLILAKKMKSRRANSVPAKKLVRDVYGEVYRVVKNKARMQPKIQRKRLSGMRAFKAMARRSRK